MAAGQNDGGSLLTVTIMHHLASAQRRVGGALLDAEDEARRGQDGDDGFLDAVLKALAGLGVDALGDLHEAVDGGVVPVSDEDWGTEFLALVLAVGVVDSVEDAIAHVNRHGSGHSEAIVTQSYDASRAFELGVDAACVYVNASTRFTDGGEFGMGAEIGNSTQKLHARGPIGLRELCAFKYLVEGDGHVRD